MAENPITLGPGDLIEAVKVAKDVSGNPDDMDKWLKLAEKGMGLFDRFKAGVVEMQQAAAAAMPKTSGAITETQTQKSAPKIRPEQVYAEALGALNKLAQMDANMTVGDALVKLRELKHLAIGEIASAMKRMEQENADARN